jgi:hypothetical protein
LGHTRSSTSARADRISTGTVFFCPQRLQQPDAVDATRHAVEDHRVERLGTV